VPVYQHGQIREQQGYLVNVIFLVPSDGHFNDAETNINQS